MTTSAPTPEALSVLKPSVHGLVRALYRHAPQPEWPESTHRARYEEAAATRPTARSVRVEPVLLAGMDAEWLLPAEVRSEQVIVYLHGGGFIMGSLATTRPLATHLALATGRRVLVLDYPLAPEVTFPGQHTAILPALLELDRRQGGRNPLVLAGDSAGGALALGAERAVREIPGRRPAITALVMLSPLLDLRLVAPSIDANAPYDPQLPRWLLQRMVTAYLGSRSPSDPAASAVLGPLHGLPPTLVQASPNEGLAGDAQLLADRARRAGASVDSQWWDGMIHVWHAFAPRLPEASGALAAVGAFLDEAAA
ncbi:steryl acetyl hydrolase [Streptomyces sp. AJS327]|uniref:alpha/beta hydrolase fold domain-containing protein n=1 Tax=Streptomyces sp. AJS327 TaxID=2545265 RepID=UPI0015E05048|nr:alpha/beta hydrolase fold domain-containing protein [Streptomyces sp. AJS327]MBA0050904.1 steryl acetyl hydrolase [Streptomyces sp. AJS327]